MSFPSFLSSCLAGVWLWLLLTVQVSVPLPTIVYGLVGEATELSIVKTAPLPVSVNLVSAEEVQTDSLIFVGDVLLARNVEFLMEKHSPYYPYQGVDFSELSIKPAVVGNFEASVPVVHKPTEVLKIDFSVHPRYLTAAKAAGFTHFSLANNHSNDFGATNFSNTVKTLSQAGLKPFGQPKGFSEQTTTVLQVEDQRVALIGLHTLEFKPTKEQLNQLLKAASAASDWQVVYVHWGTEYSGTSNQYQQQLAASLVAAGADLIVGHHPHVVQEVDLIAGVPVFYSLGNYIFDQYEEAETNQGLLLQLSFARTPVINLLPVTSQSTLSQPTRMTPGKHAEFLATLAQKSHPELRALVAAGSLPLNMSVATSSKIAMIGL
jgi:poly-gamma-glutamate capsule biosynthesis protein CapA/YwtB (metallophosphatase superfamily)